MRLGGETDQRHEAAAGQAGGFGATAHFVNDFERLRVLVADRNDQPAPVEQLREQGWWHQASRRGDDDRVEGSVFGAAQGSVADAHPNITNAKSTQSVGSRLSQTGMPLDGDNFGGQLGQDRRLIAAAGANFEHPLVPRELQGFGHQGHDVRLTNCLTAMDAYGPIGIGLALGIDGQKQFAWDGAQGRQDAGVGNAAARELLLDHFAALSVVCSRSRHVSTSPAKRPQAARPRSLFYPTRNGCAAGCVEAGCDSGCQSQTCNSTARRPRNSLMKGRNATAIRRDDSPSSGVSQSAARRFRSPPAM